MKKTKIITLFTLGISAAMLTPIIAVACGTQTTGEDKTKTPVTGNDDKNKTPGTGTGTGTGEKDKTPDTGSGTGTSDKDKNPGTGAETPGTGAGAGTGTGTGTSDKDKTPGTDTDKDKDKPASTATISTEENKKNALLDLENAYLNLRRQNDLVLNILDKINEKDPFIKDEDTQEKKQQSEKDIAELTKFAAKIRNYNASIEAIKTSVDTLKASKTDNSENLKALKQQVTSFFTQYTTDYSAFMTVIDPTQTTEKIKMDINKLDQTIFVTPNIESLKDQKLTLLDVASLIDIIGGDEIGNYLTQNVKSERPLGQVARKAIRLINLAVKNIFQKIAVAQIIEKTGTTFETLAPSFKKHEALEKERKLKSIPSEFIVKIDALSSKIEAIKTILSTITLTDDKKEKQLSELKRDFDFVEKGYLGHKMSSADGKNIDIKGLKENFKDLETKIKAAPTNSTTSILEINTAYKNGVEFSSLIKDAYFNFRDVSLNTTSSLKLATTLSSGDTTDTKLTNLKNLLTELEALIKPLSEGTETVLSIINNVDLFASVPGILLTQAAVDILSLTPTSDYLLETVASATTADIEKQI